MTMTIKQRGLLERLTKEKGIDIELDGLTAKQAHGHIQHLLKLPTLGQSPAPKQQPANQPEVGFDDIPGVTFNNSPQQVQEPVKYASKKQLDIIANLGKELNANIDMDVMRKLTVAEASDTIQKLIGVKDRQVGSGPSDKQIELLNDMAKSPAIDYENFLKLFNFKDSAIELRNKLIARHRFLLKDNSKSTEAKEISDRIVEANRFFDKAIESYDFTKLDRKEVKDFIQDNIKDFRVWKASLATDSQINLIKSLIEQVNRVNGWTVNTEISVDLEGNPIQDDVSSQYFKDDTFDIYSDWTEDDFGLLTKDCASDLINQLNIELLRLDEKSTLETTRDYDAKRNILSQKANDEVARKRLVNMIYSLEALCGTEPEVEYIEGSDVNQYLQELVGIAVTLTNVQTVNSLLENYDFTVEELLLATVHEVC